MSTPDVADAARTPAGAGAETDARLAAGEDVALAAEEDATVHQLQAAGDPAARSPFYDEPR